MRHNSSSNLCGIELYNQVMKLFDDDLYTDHYKLICEVACGYGGGLKWISDHINAQIIGFDCSSLALKKARKQGINAQYCLAPDLPSRDQSIDCVISVDSIYYYFNTDFFDEVFRVLKYGGQFIVAIDLAARYDAGIDKIRSHISDTGLTFVRGIDISANIVAACEFEYAQRQKYIRFLPRRIRESLESFIGSTSSKLMRSFKSGKRAFAIVEMRKDIVC
ncbi:class I SAM-dependent methyltransferase [Francisella philomiragia]|uniref:class I SAM-dependent methyltransferase n=2 Tax=Francisella philomiragia TaxID=28110 RepID=UPI003518193E